MLQKTECYSDITGPYAGTSKNEGRGTPFIDGHRKRIRLHS
jgi:hypothetical protein